MASARSMPLPFSRAIGIARWCALPAFVLRSGAISSRVLTPVPMTVPPLF
jgi:hypothetical protein